MARGRSRRSAADADAPVIRRAGSLRPTGDRLRSGARGRPAAGVSLAPPTRRSRVDGIALDAKQLENNVERIA
jgi:hypothetical protein